MARGIETGDHPNRKVTRERMTGEQVRAAQDAKGAAYRAARDAGTLPTYESDWTSRKQLFEDMAWDRARGD